MGERTGFTRAAITGWPFTGRARLVTELRDRIVTGEAVLVDGSPGTGKTRLVTRVAEGLHGAGWDVVTIRGTAAVQSLPYGPLAHVLPSTLPATVVNPVRWAADLLLAGLRRRRLVVVDDAHRLDPATAAVLLHLVEHHRVPMLATASAAVPSAFAEGVRAGLIERVDLLPFTAREVADLLQSALPGGVVATTARRLAELSQGNALCLSEVIRIALEHKVLEGPPWRLSGPIPVLPSVLTDLVGQRLAALDDADVDLLELVAVAEPVDAAQLETLVSIEVLARGERRGLVRAERRDGRVRVWLGHPLFGEVLRSGGQPLLLRQRFRTLAETAGRSGEPVDALRLAWWRHQAGLEQTTEDLVVAARIAWAVHDHARAVDLAGAAWQGRASVDGAILLATVLQQSGRLEAAADVLAQIRPASLAPRSRTDFALTSAQNLAHRGDLGQAMAVLDETVAAVEDSECRQDLGVARLLLVAATGNLIEAERLGRTALEGPPLGAAASAQIVTVVAAAQLVAGRGEDAAAALDRALAAIEDWREVVPALAVTLLFNRVQAGLLNGRLDEAEQAVARLAEETAHGHDFPFVDSTLALARGQIMLARGRLDDAIALLSSAEAGPLAAAARADLGVALLLCGRPAEALAAVDEARSLGLSPSPLVTMEVTVARAWLSTAESRTAEAIEWVVGAADRLVDRGLAAPAVWVLHLAVRWGAAAAVADRIADLVAEMQGQFVDLILDHAHAAAVGDGRRLMAVAERFAAAGFLPVAVDAAAQAAGCLAANGGPAEGPALHAAARARRWAGQCGRLRTPALTHLEAPALTERESQLARLAGAGWSSQQIADRFTLSVRTVDNHLQRAYAKLGVTGRRDLADLLPADPGGPSPVRPRNPG